MKENDSNYYLNAAQDYFLRGKYPEAIENYNKFIELEPDNWMPYNNCGIIYDRMKNYDEAIKYFTKAIELQDNIFAFAPFAI